MKRGWWKLTWVSTSEPEITELNDADLEHIGQLVKEGYTEGEIIQDDDEYVGDEK